jgi:hypothetical protein
MNSKLTQLRAKTDRQLVTVIGRRLDAALELARRACAIEAQKIHREITSLMPLVNTVSEIERRRLQGKLVKLETALGESAGIWAQTA